MKDWIILPITFPLFVLAIPLLFLGVGLVWLIDYLLNRCNQ